jgi:hypothetical protein
MGLLTTFSLSTALLVFPSVAALPCAAQKAPQKMAAAEITIPTAPPASATAHDFKDGHFGVKFQVPAGWSLNRKDGLVSTFHNDARSATPTAQVRGIASLDFNPYPYSTLSGAVFYYSVTPHSNDEACSREAAPEVPVPVSTDVQDIGGMRFTHGHDEHGDICVEARDEVYTAYRKGSCYRFDMEINTFCAISSGAQEITERQLQSLNQRMADILSTVTLEWTKTAAHPVPAPQPPAMVQRPSPKPESKPVADPRSAIAQR